MLDSLSVEKDDKEGRLLAAAYIGQCYLAMDQYDSCSIYFARGKEIWDAIKSHEPGDNAYKAVYVLHNSLGICAVNIENDYEKAMLHFTEGAKTASERGDTYYNIIFLSNMAVVCNIREDTSGIKYALEIYEYGRKTSDTSLISNGAYLSAMFYSKENELEKARDMLGKSLELTPKEDPRYGEMLNLYAEIFFKEGKTEDAEKYFQKAMEYVGMPCVSASAATAICLSFGNFLLEENRTGEAIMTLKKGTGIAEASDNRVHKYQLYKSLSKAYETLGDYSTALTYHKKFSKESENALNIEKERAINDLNRKYEQEKYEREIQQHNIEIKKKNRDLTIAIVFLIAAIGLSGVILSLYRKKNRLYMQIVKQYKDEFGRKARNAAHTESSDEEIFKKVERLIKDEGKYMIHGQRAYEGQDSGNDRHKQDIPVKGNQ